MVELKYKKESAKILLKAINPSNDAQECNKDSKCNEWE